jgi:hypothetical protein
MRRGSPIPLMTSLASVGRDSSKSTPSKADRPNDYDYVYGDPVDNQDLGGLYCENKRQVNSSRVLKKGVRAPDPVRGGTITVQMRCGNDRWGWRHAKTHIRESQLGETPFLLGVTAVLQRPGTSGVREQNGTYQYAGRFDLRCVLEACSGEEQVRHTATSVRFIISVNPVSGNMVNAMVR